MPSLMIPALSLSLSALSALALAGITLKARGAMENLASTLGHTVRKLRSAGILMAAFGVAVGFATPATAQTTQLLNWTTQVGGSAVNGGLSVALDGGGNIYAISFSAGGGVPTKAIKIPASDPTCSTPGDCIQIAPNFTWPTPYGGTEYPEYIAVDGSGNVFLTDGILLIKVPATDLTCSTPSDCIQIASDNSGFSYMSADSSGNLYVVAVVPSGGSGVVKYTPSGNTYTPSTLFTWSGDPAYPGFEYVSDLAVDATGDVYLIETNTTSRGNDNLVEYPIASSYTPNTIVSYTSIGVMISVALDPSGNFYVVNGAGQLFKVTPSGAISTLSANQEVGGSLAVDANGDIYDLADGLLEIHSGPVNFGSVNVGATSPLIQLNYLIGASGDVSGPSPALTQGATGQDFAVTSQTFPGAYEYYPCITDGAGGAGNICGVNVKFTPAVAGEREGAVGVLRYGVTLATTYLQGTGLAPQAVIYPGTESTLFNSATNGLSNPTSLAVDSSGNVYITDTGNGRVLKETLSGGSFTQSVVASSTPSYGVALDGAGDLYISDPSESSVLMETLSGGSYTQTTLVSGLSTPEGIAVDGAGNVYIADTANNRVLMETLSGGSYTQTTIGIELKSPQGVAVDSSGNVYIADSSNNRVLKETLSGGSYTQTTIGRGLSNPEGVTVDGAGNVYVADTGNSRVLLEAYSSGAYTQSVLLSSGLDGVSSVALDGKGNLYIADSGNNRVLELDVADPQTFSFATTPVTETSSDSPQTATLVNIGTAPLTLTIPASGNNPTIGADFQLNSGGPSACQVISSTSSQAGTLAAGSTCLLPISFVPATTGALSESLLLTDNNLNGTGATNTINLSGTGFTPVPTTTALGTSLRPSTYEQLVTFTATVTQSSGSTVPTGTVQFSADGNPVGSPVTLSGGQAGYSTSALTAGTHSITAVYTPAAETDFLSSSATPLSQIVNQLKPVITWAAPASIPYGTVLSATQLDATASTDGTFVYSPTLGTVLTAGTQVLSVTFTPTDITDYTTATKSVNLSVTKLTPTISWAAPADIAYGTALSATQLDATSPVNGTFVYSPVSGTVLNGGTHTLTATFTPTDTVDYHIAQSSVTLNVDLAPQSITFTPPSSPVVYKSVSSVALSASATSGLPVKFSVVSGPGSISGSTVVITGAGTIVVAANQAGNYDFAAAATVTQSVVVTRNTPTVSWATPAAINYGTPLGNAQLDAKTTVAGTFSYSPHAGMVLTVGPQVLSVTFTPTDTTDYTTATATVTLTVNQATPAIKWAPPAGINYGTALSTTQLDATSPVDGTFVYSPIAGTVLTGGRQTLSVTFSPNDSTDYTSATATVVVNVSPVKAVITWSAPASIPYGTPLSATQQDATANINGTFVYTPAPGTVLTAGTQVLYVSFTPADTTDYIVTTHSVSLNVTKITPTVNWAAPAAIIYGTALSATQLDATSLVDGTFAYSPASGTVLNAGSHTLTETFTPTDKVDYHIVQSTVTQVVSQASQSITFNPPSSPVVYGVSAIALSATATSGLPVKFSVVSGPGSISGSTVVITGAGTVVVAANQAGNYNYTAAPPVTQSIVVSQAVSGIALKSSKTSVTAGASVTFTATLTGNSVKPTGTVSFFDGATLLGKGRLT
jgi:sugar lactone lactonase YvrE